MTANRSRALGVVVAAVAVGAAVLGGLAAVPAASAVPAATPTTARVQPGPLVQPFSRALRAAHRKPGPKVSSTPVPLGVDGCDHSYGTPQQCVPWSFPPGVTDRCSWLAEHGLKSLVVKRRDRLALDTSKDGIACGAGDKS